MMWWPKLGWLPDPHPAAFLLPLHCRAGGEEKMKRLMGWDKDRKIIYQLLPWRKQTQLGGKEFNLVPVKVGLVVKSKDNIKKHGFLPPLLPFFPRIIFIPSFPDLLPAPHPAPWAVQGNGEWGLLWADNSSSLLLLPSHPVPLLQHGVAPRG